MLTVIMYKQTYWSIVSSGGAGPHGSTIFYRAQKIKSVSSRRKIGEGESRGKEGRERERKREREREREKRKPGSSCNAFLPLTRYPRWRGTAAAADGWCMTHTCRGAGSRAIRCRKERGGECVREKRGWRGKMGETQQRTHCFVVSGCPVPTYLAWRCSSWLWMDSWAIDADINNYFKLRCSRQNDVTAPKGF